MSLHAIVVSYRRVDQLRRCLASLARHLPETPVSVWDNVSSGTPDVRAMAHDRPDIAWTFSSSNVGFGAAVNAVAAGLPASADLLLLNQDAELTGDLSVSRTLLAAPHVAAVAPRGEGGEVAHRPLTLTRAVVSTAGFGEALRRTRLSDLYPVPPDRVEGYLGGACLLLRRAAWDEIGGFDPSFVFYGEEADWQRRAVAAGWSLRLADEQGYTHTAGGSVADDADLARRSADLLHEAQAHRLLTTGGPHRADVYAASVGVLERVQRSKRPSGRPRRTRRPAVLFSTNTLGVGGAERLQVHLAGALAERGHDVTVVAHQSFGPLVTHLSPRVRLVRRPWWSPAAVPVRGPAVLFSNETNTEAGFATMWRAAGSQRTWYVAGHTPVRADGPTYPRPLTAALRRADGFIVLAESQWDELRAHHDLGRAHVVIPNGVPTAPAQPAVADTGPVRLAMIARITEAKNPHLLTAALAELSDLDWTLDIWGDGPDRARLEALTPESIRTRVRWRGWTDDATTALAGADLVVVPSRAEVFPMVVLEAMATGVAVAASAVAALPDMLDRGRAGVLVEPVTADAWAAALREVLSDRPRLRRLAAAGRERQRAEYTLERTVDRYEALIDAAGG